MENNNVEMMKQEIEEYQTLISQLTKEITDREILRQKYIMIAYRLRKQVKNELEIHKEL